MVQRLKVTSSIALSALFLLVTAHQSNASTQSEQSITPTNFKHGYLPNYTVNSIESEQTGIKLANSWGHYKKNKRPKRRYSTRYKNSQRYREWKQRKAARSRHHYRLRSVHRAYYKKIKRAERQVIRFELSKRRTIKKLNARYKTNIKRINAQLEKVLAARKSRMKARRAKAEAAARAAAAKAQAESQARAAAKAQAEGQARAVAPQSQPNTGQGRLESGGGGKLRKLSDVMYRGPSGLTINAADVIGQALNDIETGAGNSKAYGKVQGIMVLRGSEQEGAEQCLAVKARKRITEDQFKCLESSVALFQGMQRGPSGVAGNPNVYLFIKKASDWSEYLGSWEPVGLNKEAAMSSPDLDRGDRRLSAEINWPREMCTGNLNTDMVEYMQYNECLSLGNAIIYQRR